jgi:hypothetical protein
MFCTLRLPSVPVHSNLYRMPTHPNQVSFVLTDEQHKRLEALLDGRRKHDQYATQARVLRELVDAGFKMVKV